tara:strand:+ start:9902 stop:10135 length:234 start_codon:yes stop_codon:yes gene_type:complete
MYLFKIFDIRFFIIGLFVGFVLIQIYPITKEKVIIYPSEKVQTTSQYIDGGGNCFDFSVKEVECPNNVYQIKDIPLQ